MTIFDLFDPKIYFAFLNPPPNYTLKDFENAMYELMAKRKKEERGE